MKKLFIPFLLFLFCINIVAQEINGITKIACIGNSITFGAGIANRDRDSYPSVLGQLLGEKYDVRNFGFSGRTMLLKGDRPYMKEIKYKDALEFNPDIVIIKLGTNDSKPHNWKFKNNFAADMEKMLADIQRLPSKPKVFLCYPAKVYGEQWGINDTTIVNEIIPIITQIAKKRKIDIIDFHTATDNMPENFPDKVHPNENGAIVLAETIYKSITGEARKHIRQAFQGRKSEWEGSERYDFTYNNRDVTVVVPDKAAEGNPWIWRPAFFNAFPSVDKALLTEGFHVVYYDLTHLYGSPNAVSLGNDFYKYMKEYYNLSAKVTLEGFSRGGLFALNWATKNPDKVACIYIDAPVCNLISWPGKNKELWNDMLKEWKLTDKDMNNFKGNPIDNLNVIAQYGIPVISVCGDADELVPYADNMEIVRNRLAHEGSPVEVILKPGVGHHPHSLDEPKPVVDFIVRNQPAYINKQDINIRGSLQNSYLKFEKERKGRVAFLGGSITEMEGWSEMIEKQLTQRFPYTEFEFVRAGIPSTGSTPGSFRLKHDVLKGGDVDLLFVEAAVNDDTNGFDYIGQIRGMEGEVRQALMSNPEMDIIMLYFVYEPFIESYKKGVIPDVILNHERVANYYQVPSVNSAKEISQRMSDGEFSWEQFGGVHPAPFGHDYYAASIARLFDLMWKGTNIDKKTITSHSISEKPIDKYSYFDGEFYDIENAKLSSGWKFVESWHPDNNAGKRAGFVDVAMLEAKKAGAKLTLDFEGRAIGLFCVCGPSAGIIEYSVDGMPFKKLDTFTPWSTNLYIPWAYMLEDELADGKHKLVIRISKDKNHESAGHELQIRNFLINK